MSAEYTEEERPPTVFISYSHDSPEHKRWVAEFASSLRKSGVDVILDQWDLRLGDDIPKFMERAVRTADRVLMICTETYVRKADDGVGGVGYEAMVVSSELILDLGTAKFIPVIRQESKPPNLPAAVSTRFYIDLSGGDTLEGEMERLLRELHSAPLTPKPPLGPNPFTSEAEVSDSLPYDRSELSGRKAVLREQSLNTPAETYRKAQEIVLRGEMTAWRQLVRLARASAQARLAEWWRNYGGVTPDAPDSLVEQSFVGLSAFEHLIAAALAAVGSGREKFNNQVALFEEIVMPSGWNRGGLVVRTELPHAGGFAYQAIHGALCLHTAQLSTAIRLVREDIKLPSSDTALPIFRIPDFIGWPNSLGRDSLDSWKVLMTLPERWTWLIEIFGSQEDFTRALVAYYMALNVNEYALTFARKGRSGPPATLRLETPTHFMKTSDETRRAAHRLLTADACAVCDIWRSEGLLDEQVKEAWNDWLTTCMYWHRQIYPSFRDNFADQSRLIEYAISTCVR